MPHPLLLLSGNRLKAMKDWSLLGSLPAELTLTRASNAWCFDSTGTLQQAAADVPRFDYDPVTLAIKGLLIEEQRTNSVRNSILAGTSAGTPGTPATNCGTWSNATGVTRTTLGSGTEYGMPYFDVRIYGTPTSSNTCGITLETSSGIPAVTGETWAASAFVRLVGGSLANTSNRNLLINEYSSTPSYLTGGGTVITPSAALQRFSHTRTLSHASTAYALLAIQFNVTNGSAIDFTLRVYQPQLEKGSFATSPIVTSGATVTRAADALIASGVTWASLTQGTLGVEAVTEGSSTAVWPLSILALTDGTANNRVMLRRDGGNSNANFRVRLNAADGINTSSPSNSMPVNTSRIDKLALAYSSAAIPRGVLNGTDMVSGTAGVTATAFDRINFGYATGDTGAGIDRWNGWLRRFRYWNRVLTAAELQRVTQ